MKILIVGGIHGDERTGLRICQLKGCTFEDPYIEYSIGNHVVGYLIANVQACKDNVHFISSDLNDCFGDTIKKDNLESKLQNELIKKYGKDSNKYADIVIDLHTTETSENLLMFPSTNVLPNLLKVAVDLEITPYFVPNDKNGSYCDQYLGKSGVTLELHCHPQRDWEISIALMDKYLSEFLNGIDIPFSGKIYGLKHIKDIEYPKSKDGSFLTWPNYVPDVKDLASISEGTPLIKNYITGETIVASDGKYIPTFVNVASYYEFGIAMSLCKMLSINCKGISASLST